MRPERSLGTWRRAVVPSRLLARSRELDRQQYPHTGSPAELELAPSGRDRVAVSVAHSRREPSSHSTGNHNPSTANQPPRSHAAYPLRSTVRVVLRRIMVAIGGAQARLDHPMRPDCSFRGTTKTYAT
jgi:hypothetical protein